MLKYFESKGEEKEKTKIRDKLKEYEIKEKFYIFIIYFQRNIFLIINNYFNKELYNNDGLKLFIIVIPYLISLLFKINQDILVQKL